MKILNMYIRSFPMIIGFAALLSLILSCSSNPIMTNNFTGFQEITKGENATLKWDFAYADRVKIEGIDATFDSNDSLTVSPEETVKYMITAYQGNVDSIQMSARVIVIDDQVNEETISTADDSSESGLSDYLIAIKPMEGSTEVNNFKVTRMIRKGDDGNIIIHSILIDKYGNYLRGASSESDTKLWIDINCDESSFRNNIISVKEHSNNDPNGLDIAVLIDNSASSMQNAENIKKIGRRSITYESK
jgi:hypothetical protein